MPTFAESTSPSGPEWLSSVLAKIASHGLAELEHLARAPAARNDGPAYTTALAHALLAPHEDLAAALARVRAQGFLPEEPYVVVLMEAERALAQANVHGLETALARLQSFQNVPAHQPLERMLAGWAFGLRGNMSGAIEHFVAAAGSVVASEGPWERAFDCLERLREVPMCSEPARAAARRYLQSSGRSPRAIEPVIYSLIKCAHLGPAQLERLAADPLVCTALASFCFTDPELEPMLTRIRDRLADALESSANHLDPLLRAMVVQLDLNEHVYAPGRDAARHLTAAAAAVGNAIEVLEEAEQDPERTGPLGVGAAHWERLARAAWRYALYAPLRSCAHHDRLLEVPLPLWSEVDRPIFERLLHHPAAQRTLGAEVPSLTEVRTSTSAAVRAQYEQSPYPRWTRPAVNGAIGNYLERFLPFSPALRRRLRKQKRPRALVAGCGTGKQLADMAIAFPELDITALDFSRASLGYAQWKLQQLGLRTPRFYHADILELADWKERFDIVECVGVLHHLEEPEAGLAVLRRLLAPGGVMKLGFYARRARTEISKLRATSAPVENLGQLREVRRTLLNDPGASPLILGASDFYNTSTCRDLLFHVIEHPTSLPEIAHMLSRHGLIYRELQLPSRAVLEAFQRQTPQKHWNKLDAWDAFEAQFPNTFEHMYQFFAQAP